MEIRTVIIIAIIIVALVVGYILLTGHKSTTPTTTTATNVNGTTSMTVPPYITTYNASLHSNNFTNITGENVKVLYSGPSVKNGIACNEISRATSFGYKYRTKAYSNFTFYFYVSSSNCNFTITKIGVDNIGFGIINTQPSLPYSLPIYSQIQESITVTAPGYNFSGPLSVTVYTK